MSSIFSLEREHAELKFAESYAKNHGGLLPNDSFWNYVEQRFDQALGTGHLARFNHYHPHITPLLLTNLEVMQRPPTLASAMPPVLPAMPPVLPVTPPGPPPEMPVAGIPMSPVHGPSPEIPIVSTPMGPTPVPVSVPEPASYLLLSGGLLFVLVWWLWDRKRG